jgi:hypothetical protein
MKSRALTSAAGVSLAVLALLGRGRRLRWGATDEEVQGMLAGDDLIPDADLTATRAISVRRRTDVVWPWIAQLGQGRGGWYSYDFLENLAGCQIHSAHRIAPEWQHVTVGDEVRLAPELPLTVAMVEPGRTLVMRGGVPIGRTPSPYDFTWSFTLRDEVDGSTRLLVRERYCYGRWWARPVVEVAELMSHVMSRKMLRGIRDRAEGSPPLSSPATTAGQSLDRPRESAWWCR